MKLVRFGLKTGHHTHIVHNEILGLQMIRTGYTHFIFWTHWAFSGKIVQSISL